MRGPHSCVLLLVPLAALSCAAQDVRDETDLRRTARSIVRLLSQEDVTNVASQFHYPPSYTHQQKAEDQAHVEMNLRFLLDRFGSVSDVSQLSNPIDFIEVGVSGGILPYWETLSPLQTLDFVYSAVFGHIGAGVIKVSFFQYGAGWELRGIAFGLPMTTPDALSIMETIMRELSDHMEQVGADAL